MIKAAIEQRLLTVHTHLIAKVLKYDATKQRCDLQPEVRQPKYDESGTRTAKQVPVLVDVPVAWPRFGGFRIVGRLNPGDRVLVEFMEHSLDRWKPNGGDVDPADDRRFHIADAVAIPGVADAAHVLSNAPTDRMSIGADSGATIEIHDGEVRLGSDSAVDSVLKGTAFQSALSTYVAAINTFATTCVTTPPSTPATALATAATAFLTAVSSALSSVVKVA